MLEEINARHFPCVELQGHHFRGQASRRPSRPTQPPVARTCPILAPDTRKRIERMVRIVFILDRAQPGVMASIKRLLEVRLPEVGLVEGCAAAGGELLQLREEHVGHLALVGEVEIPVDVAIRSAVCRVSTQSITSRARSKWANLRADHGVENGITPCWVHRVVGGSGVLGYIHGDT